MYQMTSKIGRYVTLMIFSGFYFLANAASATPYGEFCGKSERLALNGSFRGYSDGLGGSELFSVEVPSAGLLAIDAGVANSAERAVLLDFLGSSCVMKSVGADAAIVERSATSQVLALQDPGTYYFRVVNQGSFGEHRMTTRFVNTEVVGDIFALGQVMVKSSVFYIDQYDRKSEEEEVDPNPKTSHFNQKPILQLMSFHIASVGKSEEEEVDPNPKAGRFDIHQLRARVVLFGGARDVTGRKSEEEEVDPNPKRLHGARLLSGLITMYSVSDDKSEEEEVDPNPKSEEEEVDPNPKSEEEEVDPNPKAASTYVEHQATFTFADTLGMLKLGDGHRAFMAWLAGWVNSDKADVLGGVSAQGFQLLSYARTSEVGTPRFELGALCQRGERDDHSDTLGCATRIHLGRVMSGEISNGWGDDADVFELTLDGMRSVTVETVGDTDTFGEIYDRFGRQLVADDDSGRGHNFRLVKTLVPGRYFVRVEGANQAEGAYDLVVEGVDR